jgi:hypothetical protein
MLYLWRLALISIIHSHNGMLLIFIQCNMKGNLALGAYTHPDGIESESAQRDLRVGKGKSKSYEIVFSFRNS